HPSHRGGQSREVVVGLAAATPAPRALPLALQLRLNFLGQGGSLLLLARFRLGTLGAQLRALLKGREQTRYLVRAHVGAIITPATFGSLPSQKTDAHRLSH